MKMAKTKLARSNEVDKEPNQHSFIWFFIFVVFILLIGWLIPQNERFKELIKLTDGQSQAAFLKDFGDTLKNEIIEATRESQKKEFIKLEKRLTEELKLKLEKTNVKKISENPVEDSTEIKINKAGKPIVIDPQTIRLKEEQAEKEKKEELAAKEKKKQQTLNAEKSEAVKPTKKESKSSFKAQKISRVKPKKMWIPIPNRYS